MIAALIFAGVFLAGFWLGGAFLALAIALTQSDDGGSIGSAVLFSILWPVTIMSQL